MTTVPRSEMILYLTDWAALYGAVLKIKGTVGFGRPAVSISKYGHAIDTADVKEHYYAGDSQHKAVSGWIFQSMATVTEWWEPQDAYHKHDCLAVLAFPQDEDNLSEYDDALAQLYEWVKWLDERNFRIRDVERGPQDIVNLMLHGPVLASLYKSDSLI